MSTTLALFCTIIWKSSSDGCLATKLQGPERFRPKLSLMSKYGLQYRASKGMPLFSLPTLHFELVCIFAVQIHNLSLQPSLLHSFLEILKRRKEDVIVTI